jgi:hypothetical protein
MAQMKLWVQIRLSPGYHLVSPFYKLGTSPWSDPDNLWVHLRERARGESDLGLGILYDVLDSRLTAAYYFR